HCTQERWSRVFAVTYCSGLSRSPSHAAEDPYCAECVKQRLLFQRAGTGTKIMNPVENRSFRYPNLYFCNHWVRFVNSILEYGSPRGDCGHDGTLRIFPLAGGGRGDGDAKNPAPDAESFITEFLCRTLDRRLRTVRASLCSRRSERRPKEIHLPVEPHSNTLP